MPVGMPPAGGPVAQTTQCLEENSGVAQAGEPLDSWTCHGGANQVWSPMIRLSIPTQ